MRETASYCSARDLSWRGEYADAADLLLHALRAEVAPSELSLGCVRMLLRMGDVRRALEVIDAIDPEGCDPGLRLRLEMERQWIRCLNEFDLRGAAREVDRLWAKATTDAIELSERADALVVRLRVLRAAGIYRELSGERLASLPAELETAAATLLDAGWIDEAFAAKSLLAGWSIDAEPNAFLRLAKEAEHHGLLHEAGYSLVSEAERILKQGAPAADVQGVLDKALHCFQLAFNETGELDVARVAAELRIDRFGTSLSELEDVLTEYASRRLLSRQLTVVASLSVAAHHRGDLEEAGRYRRLEREIALQSGLLMARVNGLLAEAEILMRQRRLGDAIDVCEGALSAPLPRVMLGNFEQFLATVYSFSGDKERVGEHLSRAMALYDEVGAEDFASIIVTKQVNESVSSRFDRELRVGERLAEEWAERDWGRGYFEAAAVKFQLLAQVRMQLFRKSRTHGGLLMLLDSAADALNSARLAAERLQGAVLAREHGNTNQLRGQLALLRKDNPGAEAAYVEATELFDNAGLEMQAANSRYIVGCLKLNASADATRQGHIDDAVAAFSAAEGNFKTALRYYEDNGMRNEAVKARYMLALLYANGRALADQETSKTMAAAARELLGSIGKSIDELRTDGPTDQLFRADLVEETTKAQDLGAKLLSDDVDGFWAVYQKGRGRELARYLSSKTELPPALSAVISADLKLRRLYQLYQYLKARIGSTSGLERLILKEEKAAIENDMAAHPEFLEYLEFESGRPPSLAKVKEALSKEQRRTVLVDWPMSEDAFRLLLTSADGAELKEVSIGGAEIDAAVKELGNWENLRRALIDGPNFLRAFDPLVAPLAEHSAADDHLVLCPTGRLSLLPLHALEVDGVPLIARNLVTYAPSVSFWYRATHYRRRTAKPRDAVFADPVCDLPASPASRELGNRIAKLLGIGAVTGADATREVCLEALKAAHIFHFQGHAEFDRSDQLQSKLHLTGGGITAREIMDLGRVGEIGSVLITLGACESGTTHMAPGDEPFGLASAFLMSGARAVCAPIWPVRDTDAAAFMVAFYESLSAAEDPCVATAYRTAVLKLRDTPGLDAPYHWAPYVLSGDRTIT